MGVDCVWRTGDKRTVVFVLNHLQQAQILRFDNFDLIDRIPVSFAENIDIKLIADTELVEIRKQLGGRQSAVSADDGVRAFPSDGERRPLEVTDRDLQDRFGRSVIDTEKAVDGGDLDIADHSCSGRIENGVVFRLFLFVELHPLDDFVVRKLSVPFSGNFQQLQITILVEVCDIRCGVGDNLALMEAVPVVGEVGVEYKSQADNKKKHKDQVDYSILHPVPPAASAALN